MTSSPDRKQAAGPVFLGGHAAVDFLNTYFSPQGEPVEVLSDGDSTLRWMILAGMITEAMADKLRRGLGAERLDALASELRAIRDWAGKWIARWRAQPTANYASELRRLNTLLRPHTCYQEVTAINGNFILTERFDVREVDSLIALIAMQIATLLTQGDPAQLKRCAGKDCTLWFLDKTKGHRRIFCSASACGNRAKVAAFRARQTDS